MNTQTMQTTLKQTVSQTDTHSIPHMITKDDCQAMTDSELLHLMNRATGHTGKDFSEFMNCDFSYSFLTMELKNRGYVNGWYNPSHVAAPKATAVIQMKKADDEVTRQSYMIDKKTASEWKQFNKNVPYKTVTLGWALRRFMDDVKSGRIKFELEI